MKKAIEIKKINKKYDANFELKDIDLDIPSGSIVGLIGENGAGKTTLIKAILNIIHLDSGSIKIFEKDYLEQEITIKEDIGVVLDNMFFPELLTPLGINLIMKDIYKNWDSELYFNYLKQFDLPLKKQLKHLSKGMRKKLEIITSLAHHPKLLILDEPTSGLDPVVRTEILDLFLEFVKDESHTILFSTHITTDLEHIADYIIFLDKGQKLLEKERDEILDNYAILKCSEKEFPTIDKNDYLTYKKNKYNYDLLISDKKKISKKYKNFVIDKITLEDLMVLIVKGEK